VSNFVTDTWDWLTDPGKDERNAAKGATRQAAAGWGNVLTNLPTVDQLVTDPNEIAYYETGEELNPYLIEDRSGMIQGDALGRGIQEGAAAYFGGLATGGGIDAIAEAEYGRQRRQAEQDARSKREAALQAAEMQGGGGGQASLLADLTSGQQAATAANMAGMQAAADMQTRRDEAAKTAADLGGTLWDQTKDLTTDQFDAWYGTEEANQGAYNDAALENWNRQNAVSDYNVDLTNEATKDYAKGVQQAFDNRVTGIGGWGNALMGRANVLEGFAGQRDPWLSGQSVGKLVQGGAKAAGGNPSGGG
jgi:hypothetical protein